MTRWVPVCFVRAADALRSEATEMPADAKYRSDKEAKPMAELDLTCALFVKCRLKVLPHSVALRSNGYDSGLLDGKCVLARAQ